MAKGAAKPKKEVSMEEALWKSADKLRGSVEPAEYKHVVLSLFFLKFASDKFEAQRKLIAEKYGEKVRGQCRFLYQGQCILSAGDQPVELHHGERQAG